jgi:hypothetical protein
VGLLNSGFWILNFFCLVAAFAEAAFAQLQPCAPDPGCIVIAASSPPGVFNPDDEVTVSVTFRSAQDDGQGGGLDEIAALSLSLAVPGLELADCAGLDENGLTAAFTVAPAVAEKFVVFVENTRCLSRPDCLCPQAGQGRDDFINLVVSPRSTFDPAPPPEGPVLPDGEMLSVRMRVRRDAPSTVRLHVFSEVDDPKTLPKPGFAGFVTAGDRLSVDQTADRKSNTSRIRLIDGQLLVAGGATATSTPSATRTPTSTASATASASATHTETPGPSPTPTSSPTVTPTTDPNATPTPTATPSNTASATATPTETMESTPTATVTPSGTEATATPTNTPGATPTSTVAATCRGDCDNDGVVRVDELVTAVAIGLEAASVDDCRPVDHDGDLFVTVDELVRAVNAALGGCPP